MIFFGAACITLALLVCDLSHKRHYDWMPKDERRRTQTREGILWIALSMTMIIAFLLAEEIFMKIVP